MRPLACVLALACAGLPGMAQAAGPDAAASALQPAPPFSGALDQREIRAQLTPQRYTTLAAEIGAKIKRLPVPEGGSFRQGQVLVQFDCALQRAQIEKARAVLQGAERTWRANQRLAELHSIGKVELETSETEVLKARAEVSAGNAVLDKCEVTAPYPGRVAEQRVREQQYAQAGQPLLDILDDSTLELEFIVPSAWLAWVKVGSPAQVRIDETGKTYPARVQRVGARVDPVSQSIKLSAVIDGKFGELVAGMSGRVLMAPTTGGATP